MNKEFIKVHCLHISDSYWWTRPYFPLFHTGQAGKAKPQTGVVIPEGTDVSRDSKSGNVFAEILVQKTDSSDLMPVVTSFQSPWALGM